MSLAERSSTDSLEQAYQAALENARRLSKRLEGPSPLEHFARLPPAGRARVLEALTPAELAKLEFTWDAWARPKQKPPAETVRRILFFLAGRGFGKSRTAAERVRERVNRGARNLALIGPKTSDIERYMLGTEGEPSGLLNVFPAAEKPRYFGHPKNVVRFHTGAVGYVVSAETPEFRGANLDTVWADELAQWRFLETIWTNMELATRSVSALAPEIIVTTTPLPLRFLKELVADDDCTTILGKTDENRRNDPAWLARMTKRLGSTRLGRQELDGEILGDNPDSLFPSSVIDAARVEFAPLHLRTVVSVDPAIATDPKNDETGILVMGDDVDGHMYVLADASGRHKPDVWGKLVVDAYEQNGCVEIIGERNRGGDLIESNVRAAMERKRGGIAAKALRFTNVLATKGKVVRAEPVSALHERGLIHIVGRQPVLEGEISDWNPKLGGRSPNRLDALVWGAWFLGGLGEEDRPDPNAGFVGLENAARHLQVTTHEGAMSPVVMSLLPTDPYGEKL